MTENSKKDWEEIGFRVATGAGRCACYFAAGILVAVYVIARINPAPTDNCDASSDDRCGLAVYTDNLTGLQYLGTPGGGITPRLNADGKQVRR